MPVRELVFTPDAVRQFKKLPKAARPFLRDALRKHLIESDPGASTRNKFRLRRASAHADFELRAGHYRVFFRLTTTGAMVTLIGEKRGANLIVEGEELEV